MSSEEKKVSRRGYVKYAGAAVVVVAVGAAGAYYATQPPAPPPTTPVVTTPKPTTPGPTTPVPTTPKPTVTEPAPKDNPLMMSVWGYHPEIVMENLAIFDQQFNDASRLDLVAGAFDAAMETKFIAGANVDVCYGNPFMAFRWWEAGWIYDVDNVRKTEIVAYDVAEIAAAMYPGIKVSFTNLKGKLCGYPYFTSNRGNIVTNEKILDKAGLGKFPGGERPKTWAELYDQLVTIKTKAGVKYPFLHHWFKEWFGVTWGWIFETHNQGGLDSLFDSKTMDVTFDTNTLAADVLRKWAELYKAELCAPGALTQTESDFINAHCTGEYAYSPQQTYDVKVFNDPEKSRIPGDCNLVMPDKQPWGLLDEGMYLLCTDKTRKGPVELQRAQALQQFFGYKDKEGLLRVCKKWMIDFALNSGYAALLEDPDMLAAYGKWMTPQDRLDFHMKAMDALYAIIQYPPVWKTFWYMDWQTRMSSELPLAIMGSKPVNDVVTGLRDYAKELKAKFP